MARLINHNKKAITKTIVTSILASENINTAVDSLTNNLPKKKEGIKVVTKNVEVIKLNNTIGVS